MPSILVGVESKDEYNGPEYSRDCSEMKFYSWNYGTIKQWSSMQHRFSAGIGDVLAGSLRLYHL